MLRAGIFGVVVATLISGAVMTTALSQGDSPVQSGELGLVVSGMAHALGEEGADATGACPNGYSQGFGEIYRRSAASAQRPGEDERSYQRRAFTEMTAAPDGRNLCLHPDAAPDPHFRTVERSDIRARGIDLDGQTSRVDGRAAPGTCSHSDFRGVDGNRGVDNQYFRVMGCIRSYQPGGLADTLDAEMLAGSWSVLIALRGIDNLRDDADIQVGIYAGADPIEKGGAASRPLPFATYNAVIDPQFRSETRGRIQNGVLTTDPVDLKLKWTANGSYFERALRNARLQLTMSPNGEARGFLAGYAPIDHYYRNSVSYNDSVFMSGAAASTHGYTCNGLYAALQRLADGDRDPQTGHCTSISTQFAIEAIPAFVVVPPASGTNAEGAVAN